LEELLVVLVILVIIIVTNVFEFVRPITFRVIVLKLRMIELV